jgi:hypothetical protein
MFTNCLFFVHRFLATPETNDNDCIYIYIKTLKTWEREGVVLDIA